MYDPIAHYYHLIHQHHTADIPWVLRWAQGKILELGCGSGRLLLPLAQAGHTAVGLDLSAEMLTLARAELAGHANVTLVQGDMAQFDLPQKPFDTAVVFCNTLLHLDNVALGQMLRHTAVHLRPGGRLLIDIPNPFMLAAAEDDDEPALEQVFADPATGETVAQYSTQRLDADRQLLTLTWTFVPQQNGRDLPEKQVQTTAVYHFYYPHQLQIALQAAGFELETLAGNYAGDPFTEESDNLLLVAQRLS
ncbi:MAG: class I SAM-dependent methyltransferase [Anaerolineales bacterium]|nr:class I SAM-dependent methyltransferase [Anaerolineales bacterium]